MHFKQICKKCSKASNDTVINFLLKRRTGSLQLHEKGPVLLHIDSRKHLYLLVNTSIHGDLACTNE
ncbi:hypothetical protein SAM19_02164 [Brevibacillus laterosporus]|nr:hypothetical protein [Brevibacillus laterosporus]